MTLPGAASFAGAALELLGAVGRSEQPTSEIAVEAIANTNEILGDIGNPEQAFRGVTVRPADGGPAHHSQDIRKTNPGPDIQARVSTVILALLLAHVQSPLQSAVARGLISSLIGSLISSLISSLITSRRNRIRFQLAKEKEPRFEPIPLDRARRYTENVGNLALRVPAEEAQFNDLMEALVNGAQPA